MATQHPTTERTIASRLNEPPRKRPSRESAARAPISPERSLQALGQLLQPLAELALQAGLKHADLDALLRQALATASQRSVGHGNASKISVQTGLHRKWVAAWLQERETSQILEATQSGQTPQRKRSMASQLLMHWAKSLDAHPERVSLPLSAVSGAFSFHDLAREAVKHVHPRSVLDELVRLGLVREADGMVYLLADAFVPEGERDEQMALWAGNARAMLAAGAHNIAGKEPAQLERSIWGEGIPLEHAMDVQALARANWAQMQARLHERIAASPQTQDSAHRVRVGVYVRVEAMPASVPSPTPPDRPVTNPTHQEQP